MPKRFNLSIDGDIYSCEYDFDTHALSVEPKSDNPEVEVSGEMVRIRQNTRNTLEQKIWANANEYILRETGEPIGGLQYADDIVPLVSNDDDMPVQRSVIRASPTVRKIDAPKSDTLVYVQRNAIKTLQQMFGLTDAEENVLAVVQSIIDQSEEIYNEWKGLEKIS